MVAVMVWALIGMVVALTVGVLFTFDAVRRGVDRVLGGGR